MMTRTLLSYHRFMGECKRYHTQENKAKDQFNAEQAYVEIVNNETWTNVEHITKKIVHEDMFERYLFKWGRMNRCFYRRKREICYELLLETIREQANNIAYLRRQRIETVNIDMGISREKIVALYDAFRDFCCSEVHRQPTASAKILHILLPRLFVIWDWKYVRKTLDLENDADSYIKYLKMKKNQLTELLDSHRQVDPSANIADVVEAAEVEHGKFITQLLRQEHPSREPITKLLDEYQVMQHPSNKMTID
jgi:hypothetical protein